MKRFVFFALFIMLSLFSFRDSDACGGGKGPQHKFKPVLLDKHCPQVNNIRINIGQVWYDESAGGGCYVGQKLTQRGVYDQSIVIGVPPARSASILRAKNYPAYVITIFVNNVRCHMYPIYWSEIDRSGTNNIPIYIPSSCCN